MKYIFSINKLLVVLFLTAIASFSQAQKKFTVVSSRANNYCNTTCTLFDNPELNGNPTAVVFVTAVERNGINLDPHPITAYYNGTQWSVMNTDNASMPVGASFEVEYYSKPDDHHFVQVVTRENLQKNSSYIDNPALNGNPKAEFKFFQSASPNARGGGVNKSEIKFQYDVAVGRWYMTNSNGNALDAFTGYSISIPEVQVAINNAFNNGNNNSGTTSTTNTTPFVPGGKMDNSGARIFVSVVGKTQGQFIGESGSNRMEVTDFEMEHSSPRDIATGQASGKRQHVPILFQKALGAASPQFFKALATNEVLNTVTFEVFKPDAATGALTLCYTIVLTNASTSGFKQSFSEELKGFVDAIKVTFQTITLNFINGGISASDSWQSVN